jgi:hypothetical protein
LQDPPKIYPNWDFWFENKPSGNPGQGRFSETLRHSKTNRKAFCPDLLAALPNVLIDKNLLYLWSIFEAWK